MEWIKVGRTQYNKSVLLEYTLEECYLMFSHIDRKEVKKAWELANPKAKAKPKPAKPDEE